MSSTFRPYVPADLGACLDVFDTNVPRFFTPEERGEFEAFLEALPGPYVVLADASRRVVACGGYAVRDGTDVADLCWGMVRGELHGTGLGRALLELRIQRIREDPGVRTVALHTSQHTVGFYERFGFRVVGVEPGAYGPGLDRHDMRLEVAGAG